MIVPRGGRGRFAVVSVHSALIVLSAYTVRLGVFLGDPSLAFPSYLLLLLGFASLLAGGVVTRDRLLVGGGVAVTTFLACLPLFFPFGLGLCVFALYLALAFGAVVLVLGFGFPHAVLVVVVFLLGGGVWDPFVLAVVYGVCAVIVEARVDAFARIIRRVLLASAGEADKLDKE